MATKVISAPGSSPAASIAPELERPRRRRRRRRRCPCTCQPRARSARPIVPPIRPRPTTLRAPRSAISHAAEVGGAARTAPSRNTWCSSARGRSVSTCIRTRMHSGQPALDVELPGAEERARRPARRPGPPWPGSAEWMSAVAVRMTLITSSLVEPLRSNSASTSAVDPDRASGRGCPRRRWWRRAGARTAGGHGGAWLAGGAAAGDAARSRGPHLVEW